MDNKKKEVKKEVKMHLIQRDEKNLKVVVTENYNVENSLYFYVTTLIDYNKGSEHEYHAFDLTFALQIHSKLVKRYLK